MFVKANEGSTKNLIHMCVMYFICYVATGFTVKYFMGPADQGFPGLNGIEYLVYSTAAAMMVPLLIILIGRWYRFESHRRVNFLGAKMPVEFFYIIPSGLCTAVVIPTTTLMYTLPISVMVAMVIMRGSVIVISRFVDSIQIKQGILHKKVYAEENWAVLFAVVAVAINIFWASGQPGQFDFLQSTAAMAILGSYIVAYAIRIYIMNYYKNSAGKGLKRDNYGFFAIEQFAAMGGVALTAYLVFNSPALFGWEGIAQIEIFRSTILTPKVGWSWAALSGVTFGLVAVYSVFLFMFKGRTATFAGLVNRLTSLIAGTAATLLFYYFFGGKFPKTEDWASLAFILVAIGFMAAAEKKRVRELEKTHELELEDRLIQKQVISPQTA